jgi:hypothetical protein
VQVHYDCSVARQAPRGLAHAKPLDPGHHQAPRTGPTASPSINPFASHTSHGESNSANRPGLARPTLFAALRQGMQMGSDSPERRDFGPAYHSREGRVIKGRSLNFRFSSFIIILYPSSNNECSYSGDIFLRDRFKLSPV